MTSIARRYSLRSTTLAGRYSVSPAGPSAASEHLALDQLDVLVVDVDALGLVDLLDLLDEVELDLRPALGRL